MLEPLSARALQQLLGKTLAAVEIAGSVVQISEPCELQQVAQSAIRGARLMSQLSGAESGAIRALNACGFVALMRLNGDAMVSNFAQQDSGVHLVSCNKQLHVRCECLC